MVKKFLSAGLCCVLLGGCLTSEPAAPAKKDEKKCQQKCDKKAKECPKKADKKCDKKAKECPKKADEKAVKTAPAKKAEKTVPAKKTVKAAPAKKAEKTAPAKDSFKIEKCTITGKTEADKFVYAPGEKMVFIINFNAGKQEIPAGKYNLAILRDGDDGINKTEKYDLAKVKEPIRFTTSTDKPGFVRVRAVIRNEKNRWIGKAEQRFEGGAGVGIDQLKPAAQEPADFDAFWASQKKRLDAVPIKAERTLISKADAPVLVYAVKIDCAGPRPVTGYLTIPANAKAKSLAAQVNYQGYGTRVQTAPKTGSKNKIQLIINAHGYDLGKDKAYYKDFFEKIKSNGVKYAFDPKQNSDREAAYFNGMALRVMRSLQYVKSLPEWNGKTLIVSGGSQGGLQTMWAAALDKDVTEAHPCITWCCDLAGNTKLKRLNGWRPSYVPALDYYDAVFHARRIKCFTNITRAGLGDYVCPPSGLAISYNELNCPKRITWCQNSTHGYVQKGGQRFPMTNKIKK